MGLTSILKSDKEHAAEKTKKKVIIVIPLADFKNIFTHEKLNTSRCSGMWCGTSETICHVREFKKQVLEWWNQANGEKMPGFSNYESVLENAIRYKNNLYYAFRHRITDSPEKVHEELAKQVIGSFKGNTLDQKHGYPGRLS